MSAVGRILTQGVNPRNVLCGPRHSFAASNRLRLVRRCGSPSVLDCCTVRPNQPTNVPRFLVLRSKHGRRPLHGFRNRLRVQVVVLVRLQVRLHILRRHESGIVPLIHQRTSEVNELPRRLPFQSASACGLLCKSAAVFVIASCEAQIHHEAEANQVKGGLAQVDADRRKSPMVKPPAS
jgi:hypothetical protein